MIIRIVSQQDNTRTVVLAFSFYLSLFTLPPALFVWQTPSWEVLGALVLCGLLAGRAVAVAVFILRTDCPRCARCASP